MAFTIGSSAPNVLTANLDTVLTLAFANSGDAIFDAISKNLALFYEIKKNGMYEGVDSPEPLITVPLMYGLGEMEWYEGWDTLRTQPVEGITEATYAWRQAACAAGYNRREARVTSASKIKEIAKVKVEQTQMTMAEGFSRAFLQGNVNNPTGTLTTPNVSNTTGRSGIEPLASLIYYKSGTTTINQPSDALTVGGLAQGTYNWWRNWSQDASGITTYAALLAAFDNMVEYCNRGAGGKIDLIIVDPTTKSLLNSAYYATYRRTLDSQNDYPFDNLLFRGAKVIADELVPDVHTGAADWSVKGSAYFINSKMVRIKYDKQCNFTLTDLQKPVNQDGKIGHVLWMGNACMMNRRKHGVIGDIARTLT